MTGLLLLILTIIIQLQDVNKVQAHHDLEILLAELPRTDLWERQDLADNEERLFLASAASQALFRARATAPDRQGAIDSVLQQLATWVTQRRNFREWNFTRQWDQEVFFLAHAATILGHYQLATENEVFDKDLRAIGNHLGQRIQRGRYKHLVSRPDEDFFRPADNAAALYAISLCDAYYGTDYLSPNYQDWTTYLQEELYYAESRLPCAAFSVTNRCQLEPNAAATGLYIAYRAAAAPERVTDDIPWREWLHYFKRTSLSPFSVSVRSNMRRGETARFCDDGAAPLKCERYEAAIGLWAAAEYGGSYTYFRLFSTEVLRRWFRPATDYPSLSTARRTPALTLVALRTIGETR